VKAGWGILSTVLDFCQQKARPLAQLTADQSAALMEPSALISDGLFFGQAVSIFSVSGDIVSNKLDIHQLTKNVKVRLYVIDVMQCRIRISGDFIWDPERITANDEPNRERILDVAEQNTVVTYIGR